MKQVQASQYITKSKGFTLVEVLAVLFINVVIASIIVGFSVNQLEKTIFTYVEEQILMLIKEAQAEAFKNKKVIFVQEYGEYVRIRDVATYTTINQIKLPDGMRVTMSNNRIVFSSNGNVQSSGTLSIEYKNNIQRYTYNIGHGRIVKK